ncbi:Uncharacterised protein [Mycobacteroides abscessus]|nr:Uncharacterised protein [Mycobacteroides abscessus]
MDSTSPRSVSSETPRQDVPNFDQRVTQWMSTVGSSWGSARRSAHDQERVAPVSVVTSKRQVAVSTRGVGPAESTGKPVSTYWPGGSATPCGRGRPWKPGVRVLMAHGRRGPPGRARGQASASPRGGAATRRTTASRSHARYRSRDQPAPAAKCVQPSGARR